MEALSIPCKIQDKIVAKGCFSGTPNFPSEAIWLEFLLTPPARGGGPCPFAKITPFKTSFGFLYSILQIRVISYGDE
jgi:hypothetical protein